MQAMLDEYRTISAPSEGLYKEKASKFLAFAFPVETEAEISAIQKELRKKYYDARHHVYAFRLGADLNLYRCSDDGEPANSSGPPVLGQIRSMELTNVLVVVIRYFGGTKLGIPGLINAYRSAAQDALQNATIITKLVLNSLQIKCTYPQVSEVLRLVKTEDLIVENQIFTDNIEIKIGVRLSKLTSIKERLLKIPGLECNSIK